MAISLNKFLILRTNAECGKYSSYTVEQVNGMEPCPQCLLCSSPHSRLEITLADKHTAVGVIVSRDRVLCV